jgi:hypothetical protein
MEFQKFWFKPTHQREGQPEVEFELQPLDLRTLYTVQAARTDKGINVDGAIAAFEFSVTNWRGIEPAFSRRAKISVLNSVGEVDWMVWLGQIAGELYMRALIGGDAAKNS